MSTEQCVCANELSKLNVLDIANLPFFSTLKIMGRHNHKFL